MNGQGGSALQRCKTCGKEYTSVQAMTYSEYGYCSWDCLMKKKTHTGNQNNNARSNRRNNGQRAYAGSRSKWA